MNALIRFGFNDKWYKMKFVASHYTRWWKWPLRIEKWKKNTQHHIEEKEEKRAMMRTCIQIACSINGLVCRKEKPPGKLEGAVNHQRNTKIEVKPTYKHTHVYTSTHSRNIIYEIKFTFLLMMSIQLSPSPFFLSFSIFFPLSAVFSSIQTSWWHTNSVK